MFRVAINTIKIMLCFVLFLLLFIFAAELLRSFHIGAKQ